MGLKCGIVGLPNVGKSTLFNALTTGRAAAENYAFCTIEPNAGVVALPDSRLDKLGKAAHSAKIIPAAVEFVDIAGLVKGAASGAGLGNRFLSHIRETDGIVHVVRCFSQGEVAHISGKISPLDDIETVNLELILADMETAERAKSRAERIGKSGDKEAAETTAVAEKLRAHLDKGHPARTLSLNEREREKADSLCLLTMKPVVYAANVDEDGFQNNSQLDLVRAAAEKENAKVAPLCARLEAEMSDLSYSEKMELLKELGVNETGLARLVREVFSLLGLHTFFTAGPKEARAWTIRKGANAREAAGVIHSDFARGFIRAEVANADDFILCGGESGVRERGKLRQEGRDYIVRDGDVIHFKFNV